MGKDVGEQLHVGRLPDKKVSTANNCYTSLLQTESPLLSHGMSSVSVCHLKIGESGNHGSL